MNGDEIGSLVRQVLTAVLSTTTAATYVSHDQTVALAAGAATLASIAWSVYAHWDMKKVLAGRNCLKINGAEGRFSVSIRHCARPGGCRGDQRSYELSSGHQNA